MITNASILSPTLQVVELVDADTTLHSGGNLLHVVLAPLERGELAGVNHDTVTDKPALRRLSDLTVSDKTAGDRSDASRS